MIFSVVLNQGEFLQEGYYRVSRRNWDHRLADLNCWYIDLLADLAEVIPLIV